MECPWYEQEEPTHEYVMKDIKTSFDSWNYSQVDLHTVHKIIKKCVDIEYNQYKSFGSYRGYATFGHCSILKNVKIHIDEHIRQVARETIRKNSILINWVNHILYRPPNGQEEKEGIRYKLVKSNFESLCE